MQKLADHINTINRQTVLVRCNFDVPLENGGVGDTTRIEEALPTLKLLLNAQNQLILLAHAGRPEGHYQASESLQPMIAILEKLLNQPIGFIPYQPDIASLTLPPGPAVSLLDNLRFWPDEENNTPAFSQNLARFGQVYVNEAFANCHRHHASMVGLPSHFPHSSFAGLALSQEIEILTKVTQQPDQPLVVVIGGAKLETKEPLVTALAPTASAILVGGKIAGDLKSKGVSLPGNVDVAELTPDGRDITETAARRFAAQILSAKTVIWNGTMGVFEDSSQQLGTRIVAEAVNRTPGFTLVGGGDTEAALTQLNLESGIDHISTGGGAMLTYLSTKSLAAVTALG